MNNPSSPDASSAADQARWFSEEIYPHASQLRSYLRGTFPAVRDVDDVVQESFVRAWRVRATQPVQFAKAFLFKIAQRLAVDAIRHERASPVFSVADLHALPVIDSGSNAAEAASVSQEVALLLDAIDTLPGRCREILVLRKLHGLSQREVAARLGLSEHTIHVQVARGLHRCEKYLWRRGVRPSGDALMTMRTREIRSENALDAQLSRGRSSAAREADAETPVGTPARVGRKSPE